MAPHLTTPVTGPLQELVRVPPFYGSADVRNAGFQQAPVAGGFYRLHTGRGAALEVRAANA